MNWRDRRLLDLFGIEHPIIQAPMAGLSSGAMTIAVSQAGGLGSIAGAGLSTDALRTEMQLVKQGTGRPVNANFFVHKHVPYDAASQSRWLKRLEPLFREVGAGPRLAGSGAGRPPFDAAQCEIVLEYRPKVASFHYGLPEQGLVRRLKDAGILIMSSATTTEEARWLEARGCDAIIAQGVEAGGHRGMFLTDDIGRQAGTFALVPQIVDAVRVPVIAAGGIGDGRGIAAALALGAAGVQIGTGFLLTPEARTSPHHRASLKTASDNSTTLANVFTGRPARAIVNRYISEVGPMSADAPVFPWASGVATKLRSEAEAKGSRDFAMMLSGQAPSLAREMPSDALIARLVEETETVMKRLA